MSRHHNEAHRRHGAAFGDDTFGRMAEAFARFFGTPRFILGQTAVVLVWLALNAAVVALRWDPYPFILLNLAFSTQAAYAAPLILLAQTRQADRDKAYAEADARHREETTRGITLLLAENTRLTKQVRDLLEVNTSLTRRLALHTVEPDAPVAGTEG